MAKKSSKKTTARKTTARKSATKKTTARKSATKKTTATEPETAPETAPETEPETAPETATGPAKKGDEYKRVQTYAVIPGVGKVKTTVIEVVFEGKTHRETTRHACWIWLKGKRAEKRELVKAQKESDRIEKANKRYEKMAPRMTETLAHVSRKLEGLAAAPVISDAHREQLENAINLINAVVAERKKLDEDGKVNDEDA